MKQKEFPIALSYDDVLLVPDYSNINSRSEVDLSTQLTPRLTLKAPLISSNMSDITGVDMAITLGKLGGLGVLPRFSDIETQIQMIEEVKKAGVPVAASIGCKDGFLARSRRLVDSGADVLVLDVAHGHMQQALDATEALYREFGKDIDIIAGNVATYKGASDLFRAGAKCVKAGVGPGSICLTREVTGVGVPQLTAVLEAAQAARDFDGTIMADGGAKNSGDVVKALCAGASAVMMGNQFAGTDEAPGEIVDMNGQRFKRYNGSTSREEKKNHVLNMVAVGDTYLQHVEGTEALVPVRGSVERVVREFSANIRSGLSYVGARTIPEAWEKAEFVRVTPLGLRENGAHDVLPINGNGAH